jgi:hypothetical protein
MSAEDEMKARILAFLLSAFAQLRVLPNEGVIRLNLAWAPWDSRRRHRLNF